MTDPGRPFHILLYDDHCPLCQFQMRLLSWLDWFNKVRFWPVSEARSKDLVPQVSEEQLLEAIHCVTPGGRVYRGARAFRFIGWRLPVLWPLAVLLWVPGVIYVAELIYQWISRNRLLLSKVFGCQGACAVMPARRRRGDGVGEKEAPVQ